MRRQSEARPPLSGQRLPVERRRAGGLPAQEVLRLQAAALAQVALPLLGVLSRRAVRKPQEVRRLFRIQVVQPRLLRLVVACQPVEVPAITPVVCSLRWVARPTIAEGTPPEANWVWEASPPSVERPLPKATRCQRTPAPRPTREAAAVASRVVRTARSRLHCSVPLGSYCSDRAGDEPRESEFARELGSI